MGRRIFPRPWTRGYRRGILRSGEQALLSVLLGLALAFFLIRQFNQSLRPQLVALAEAQLQNQLTLTANQITARILTEDALTYEDMVVFHGGEGGQVSTLSTDTGRLNILRTSVLTELIPQLEALDSRSMAIPLGLLTGVDLLSSLGPNLPIRVVSVASATGEYRNEFTSAGINQTLHRIYLDIRVTARLLLPGNIVETVLTTPVCVAETVIIGQVPQTYLNWNS